MRRPRHHGVVSQSCKPCVSPSPDGHACFARPQKAQLAEHSKLDQIRQLREARLLKAERANAASKTSEKPPDLEKPADEKP